MPATSDSISQPADDGERGIRISPWVGHLERSRHRERYPEAYGLLARQHHSAPNHSDHFERLTSQWNSLPDDRGIGAET